MRILDINNNNSLINIILIFSKLINKYNYIRNMIIDIKNNKYI